MKHLMSSLTAVSLSFAFLSASAATKYAICVGINQYTNPGCNPLQGCVKDADNMYSLLVDKGGWSSGNVRKMLNSSATKSAVANAIADFAGKAQSGDTFVYTQSSHGGENALCMYNADYSAADFGAALRQFKTGVKVVCVIDTCHSGSLANKGEAKLFDAASFVAAAGESIDALNAKERGLPRNITKDAVGWCCAAGSNQTSLDAPASQGGWFTYPLYKSAYTGAADATQSDSGYVETNGDLYRSYGNGDGKCSAYEAFKYAWSQLQYFPAIDNYGNAGDANQHIPQIFNEDACKAVYLSENSGLERVSKALTAYGIDYSTVENCGYEWENSKYMAGGFVAKKGVGVSGGLCLQAAPTRCLGSNQLIIPVSGRGMVTFKWKVSSQSNYGALKFYIVDVDGSVNVTRKITGTGGGWSEISYTINEPGEHLLIWEYSREDPEIAGEDTGWIDQISWTGGGSGSGSDINACLDNHYLQFSQQSTASFPEWASFENNSCLRVASQGKEGLAMLSTTVTGPCIVDFDWVCYSPNGKSIVALMMDGEIVTVGDIGGYTDWLSEYAVVPEGQHELAWVFYSSASGASTANDFAKIDRIAVHYQLTVSPGEGSGSVTMPSNCTYGPFANNEYFYEVGSEITLPSADSLSYEYGTFQGWSCNGVTYDAGSGFQMPAAPTTITAQWGADQSSDSFMLAYGNSGFFQGKGTYSGYVLEGDSANWACGAVIGFATIKTAKMKNGSSAVTMSLDLAGEKKTIKLKGATGWGSQYVDVATATLAGNGCVVKLNLTHKNVWAYVHTPKGSFFLDAARQFSGDAYAARMNAAKKNYKMACFSYPYSGNTALGESYAGLSLQVGSKGKTKITGVLPDQAKVSGKVNLVVDDLGVYLPVFAKINSKKGSFGGFLLSCANAQPVLDAYGNWDGTGGKYPLKALLVFEAGEVAGRNPKNTWYLLETFGTIPGSFNGSQVLLSEFPGWTAYEYLTFDGKKWTQMQPDEKKMSLSYAAKTGLVKGKFNFLTTNGKKNKAVVNGVYFSNLLQDGLMPCSISVKGKLTLYGFLQ